MMKLIRLENRQIILKILYIFAACLLLTLLIYFYFLSARIEELRNLKKQEAEFNARYFSDYKKIRQFDALQEQLNKLKNFYQHQIKYSKNIDQSKMIKNISRSAKSFNLHLRSLNFYSRTANNSIYSDSFKLDVIGRYRNINKFLKQLMQRPANYILNRIRLIHNNKEYLCHLDFDISNLIDNKDTYYD